MLPQEVIRAKRDGQMLEPGHIAGFVQGLCNGTISEGQAAAFAMAIFFNGMSRNEAVALTLAMRDSGTVLDWSETAGGRPVVDKHSTGGIGDNVSLVLAPMLAACGAFVPMISGRGLGHTGGTLDKLDSIPGYTSQPGLGQFRKAASAAGCAIIGQTADLAPADKQLYAIRDVTATVESVPLITASILSKKLAAGLGSLVLDVKVGSGAFMATTEDARALASSLVSVANGAGLATSAILTDMDEPLAPVAGNSVEVLNAIGFLTGAERCARLRDVTMALGCELLCLSGLAVTAHDALQALEQSLKTGAAVECFARMTGALGGPADLVEKPGSYLEVAPLEVAVYPERAGYVSSIDGRQIGLAVIELGGGRKRPEDKIDHCVGLTRLAGRCEQVDRDHPLAIVHARDRTSADQAVERIRQAYTIAAEPPERRTAILQHLKADDI